MMNRKRQRGFSLVTAIFLITVLVTLGSCLITISSSSQQVPVLGLNGAQAYHAARAGLEWGIARAINTGGGSQTVCDGVFALGQYTVTVVCSFTVHNDDGTLVDIYSIDSTATVGAPGDLGYASRTLHATVSPDEPET